MKLYSIEFNPEYPKQLKILFNSTYLQKDANQLLTNMFEWCLRYNCGNRSAWDSFVFKTQKDMTMFLLKWK